MRSLPLKRGTTFSSNQMDTAGSPGSLVASRLDDSTATNQSKYGNQLLALQLECMLQSAAPARWIDEVFGTFLISH